MDVLFLIAFVSYFIITNQNTYPVEVVNPNKTTQAIPPKEHRTFSSHGTYIIKQSGADGVFFRLEYPVTRILSTPVPTGSLNGDFTVASVLN